VDATYGGGGHARGILERLDKNGRLIGFDQDLDARQNAINDKRFELVTQNFKYLKRFLRWHKALPVDGILADLGVSSYQFDTAGRGFSIRHNAPLDMRMNHRGRLTAADLVNTYSADQLQWVFQEYGEVTNAKTLAKGIVRAREQERVQTTGRLLQVIDPYVKGKRNKYLAQVFQALRIEVNGEIKALQQFLVQAAEVLKSGGRLVVISYHSLEDRLVKNYFKRGGFGEDLVKDFYGNPIKPFKEVNKKPIVPAEAEIARNPRARSAKMRIAEKT
jgi:16S rRNA (cytosine1402-N4)-methyltransferase